MLVASRIIPLRLIQCCRPLEQTAMARMMTPVRRNVGKNHDLADSSVPVTTTNHLTQQPYVKNHLTQQPYVKNQSAEWLTL
jgi:hypothetical protein